MRRITSRSGLGLIGGRFGLIGRARLSSAATAPLATPAAGASRAPSLPFAQFCYDLPEELIAQRPAEPHGASRLLLSRAGGGVSSHQFAELEALIPEGAHLVFNHSSVVNARLRARLPNVARPPVEVMLLAPVAAEGEADPAQAFGQPAHGQVWKAMVRYPIAAAGGAPLVVGDGSLQLEVLQVLGEWDEPGEAPGVEAHLRVVCAEGGAGRALPMARLLEDIGEVRDLLRSLDTYCLSADPGPGPPFWG